MSKTYKILAATLIVVSALSAGAIISSSNNATTASTPAAISQVDQTSVVSGSFEGRSDHVTSGGVTVVKTASGYALELDASFYLDGAPDPVIGFGNDGRYDTASQFTELNKKRGQQRYDLPADFVPSQYSEVYVWCEQFAVPLGVATLN
jgi:hypothetical protein